MIQNVLQDIGGVGVYGVASVCLFFLVFTIALIRAFSHKKKHLNNMSSLPLDENENDNLRSSRHE